MTRRRRAGAVLAAIVASTALAAAQATRPRASLQPAVAEVTAAPGTGVELILNVSMPPDVHVQAHQPKDPLLIPTILTVEAPAGIGVEAIAYPSPTEFTQAGRPEPLLVLGPRFDIRVRVSVAADTGEGMRSVPVVLRYQACNETVCFPPARATAAWTVTVTRTR
jgi:DsbC/DsbD-like thiol-disulfide interchange protein